MRELKHHEKKLLRKVSLYSWKGEENLRVAKVMRKYHVQNRDDLVAYQRICGQVTKLSAKLKVSGRQHLQVFPYVRMFTQKFWQPF
jgi:U3 small nucleolar ribonucleoprotein protein IMP3